MSDSGVRKAAPEAPLFVSFKMRGGALALTGRRIEGAAVAWLLKRRAAAAGIPAARISGHSLRRGAAHEIIANGADLLALADAGGWRSLDVARGYADEAQRFSRNLLKGRL